MMPNMSARVVFVFRYIIIVYIVITRMVGKVVVAQPGTAETGGDGREIIGIRG